VDQTPPDTRIRNNANVTGAAPLPGDEAPGTQITVDRSPTAPPGDGPEHPPTGAPAATPGSPPAYPVVTGYEILTELGHGGMGVVYKARQVKANRVVALKMILARAHATLEQKVRFQIEAEAIAALQHPNIVQLYEVGECDGLPFFSLEFVEGGSLDDLLKERRATGKPLVPREAAALVETLARAMHYAHSHGVIHRDLKPANILLAPASGGGADVAGSAPPPKAGANWVPKITDFGLAKRLDEAGAVSQSGAIMGTPDYMAPEQAAGRVRDISGAADVWALGVILYELMTGRRPFRGANDFDTLRKVLSEEPVPPSRHRRRMPGDLETICLGCLHKDPGRRYASAEGLAEDLRRFCMGEPIAARPVGRWERAVKWMRRNPAVTGLLASLVLGTAVAVFFAIRANEKAAEAQKETKRADREAVLAKQNAVKEKEARTEAEKEKQAAQFQANARHAIQLDQALRAWEQNDMVEANRILGEVNPTLQQTWETRHLHEICHRKVMGLLGHKGPVSSVAISSDGRWIVLGSGPSSDRQGRRLLGEVTIWDAATGQQLHTLHGHTWWVKSVAISRDGKRIVSGGAGYDVKTEKTWGEVEVWDAVTGKALNNLQGHTCGVLSVALNADGSRIISGAGAYDRKTNKSSGELKVWEAATGQALLSFRGLNFAVYSVALSGDGKRIVSGIGGYDLKTKKSWGEVKVWDAATGQELRTLPRHTGHVLSVAFSSDGRRIVSGSRDGTVKVWDAATGEEQLSVRGHTEGISSVALSGDGKRIVSGSRDKTVNVWDAATGEEKLTLKGLSFSTVAITSDGRKIVSGHEVWDLAAGQAKITLTGAARTGAISADGRRIVSATGDGMVKVWDTATGQQLLTFKGGAWDTLRSVVIRSDGRQIFLVWEHLGLQVCDAATGQSQRTFLRANGNVFNNVYSVALSGHGKRIVSGHLGGMVKVSDMATGQLKLTLRGHTHPVSKVALSSDGRRVFSASLDGRVQVWDAATGQRLRALAWDKNSVNSVAFSPVGRHIAVTGGDFIHRDVSLWDAATGQKLRTLKGHTRDVHSVAFSHDGKRIVSGSADRTVRVWDAATGQEKLTLKGHTSEVINVVFSSNGQRIVSVSGDGTVKVWAAEPVK
jgi:WD40 repeat protein/serine/threonine protein kinase